MKKRILSLLLALCLIWSMVPVTALAEADAVSITHIDMVKEPEKTTFLVGEYLDFLGAVLRVHFSDGTYEDIEVTQHTYGFNKYLPYNCEKLIRSDELSFSADKFDEPGQQTVEIGYMGLSVTCEVKIVENSISAITIQDSSGLDFIVNATCADGTEEEIAVVWYEPGLGDSTEDFSMTGGHLVTSLGCYYAEFYSMSNGETYMTLDLGEDNTITSNTLSRFEWLDRIERIDHFIWSAINTQPSGYRFTGEVDASNIDSLIVILDCHCGFDLTFKDGDWFCQGDSIRTAMYDVFGLTSVDLTLSDRYDGETDTYLMNDSGYGGPSGLIPPVIENEDDYYLLTVFNLMGERMSLVLDGDMKVRSFEITEEKHIHLFEEEILEATCTEEGQIIYTCSCGASYTDVIPATGYNWEGTVYEPTCTEAGYTWYTCDYCGDSYTDHYTEATGHMFDNGFCLWCGEADLNSPNYAVIDQGTCGENLTWVLTEDGTLTISGEGEMEDNVTAWDVYRHQIEDIHLISGVTSIGDYAFIDCVNLRSITIPDSITHIGDFAVYGCTNLLSVTIPDSVISIGISAFALSSNLTGFCVSEENPNYSVDEYDVLYNKEKNHIIQLPGSFNGTYRMSENVTGYDGAAFVGCRNLIGIDVDDKNLHFSNDDRGVLFSKDKTALLQAPGGIKNTYEIPDEVIKIGEHAFFDCDSLTDVVIPDSVLSIDQIAFFNCDNLSTVTIGKNVTKIADMAFGYCYGLHEIYFCGSAPEFSYDAFYEVIATAYYPNGNSTWISSIKQDYGGTINWVRCTPTDNHNHRYESSVTDPTCTEQGYTTYVCSLCGHRYTADETSALGHTWEDEVFDPTCTEQGYTLHVCLVCYDTYMDNYTNPVPHSFEDGICTVCGMWEDEIARGSCGENLTWVLTKDGILTVFGQGDMTLTIIDEYGNLDMPWHHYRKQIMSVVINDGVTSICSSAFSYSPCPNLTSVIIGNSVTTIGDYAFADCTSLSNISFGKSVNTIGNFAFGYCDSLTNIALPDKLTEIGDQAFYCCSNLTNIKLPDGMTLIGDEVFYGCFTLSNVVLPDSLTTIGSRAFYNSRLRNITIPDSVTSIGDEAFSNCAYLIRATIGNGVAEIGDRTFYNCPNLSNVRIGDSVASIGESAFYGCTKLLNADFSSGVTTIDEMAFYNCDSLKSISLPGVVTIGREAFYSCDALASAEFGSDLSAIDIFAFDSCFNLSEITFYGDAPDIGYEAFYGATANANYPEENETWTSDVMQDYGGELTWIPYSTNAEIASGWSGNTQWILTSDGVLTVYGNGNMKNYGYGGNQPWISYADQITSIVIEDGVTAVGDGAFMGLTKLESVTLPDTGLTKIGEAAFYGCSSLKEIDIPDSVYTVFDYTFKNCTSLESVRLSKILIKVGQGAFENCSSLSYISIPSDVGIVGSWSFKGCTGLVEADMQWADATEIREGAFKNCSSLMEIILPANIQKLGDSCFYGIGATSFTIPETVTEVGPWCFARANLTQITFEGNAPTIGEGAFNKIALTAYYPGDNATWNSAVMQNYGGAITWKAN